MVSFFGFFKFSQILIEFLLARETCSVYSLEHRPAGITPPVSSRDTLKLHSFNLSGVFHVKPCTQIHKISLLIKRNRFILRQVFYKLYFIYLSLRLHEFYSLFSGKDKLFQRIISLYYLFHFLLYFQKILIIKLMFHIKIIIKTVIYGRPYRQFCIRPKFFHSLSHYM